MKLCIHVTVVSSQIKRVVLWLGMRVNHEWV